MLKLGEKVKRGPMRKNTLLNENYEEKKKNTLGLSTVKPVGQHCY